MIFKTIKTITSTKTGLDIIVDDRTFSFEGDKDRFSFYESENGIRIVGTYYHNRNAGLTIHYNSKTNTIQIFMPDQKRMGIKYHYSLIDPGEIFNDYWEVIVGGNSRVLTGIQEIRIDI